MTTAPPAKPHGRIIVIEGVDSDGQPFVTITRRP